MIIEIPAWTSHHNQLLYSATYSLKNNYSKFRIVENPALHKHVAVIKRNDMTICCDYSDDAAMAHRTDSYDLYFKRSLRPGNHPSNVRPLNFQVNFSYRIPVLLSKFSPVFLTKRKNRKELLNALDAFAWCRPLAHSSMDLRSFTKESRGNGGRVIFLTRLWDPGTKSEQEERGRRLKQNDFRINAIRIIRKYFPNSITGLYPSRHAMDTAPDLLIDQRMSRKSEYFNALGKSDICIADDGLSDTPGWKIGEFTMFGKSIVTTPISCVVENFEAGTHYLATGDRSSWQELPDLIRALKSDRRYLEMGGLNHLWSEQHLYPGKYMQRILDARVSHSTTVQNRSC